MSILVTGATGLVGSNIVRLLIEQGRDVVGHDRLPPVEPSVLTPFKDRLKLEIGNVAELSQILHVIKRHHVEGIIHCAGMVGDVTNQFPVETIQVNILGCANMLEAARIMGLGRVIIYSSSGVMGAPEDLVTPRKEEEIVLPAIGMYVATKLACEQVVATYRQFYRVDTFAVRPRCVYGPAQQRYRLPLPIYHVLEDVLAGKPVVRETGGDTSFDYTYVKDLAKGTVQAYDSKSPSYYVYNLSRGKNTKMSEVCDVLKRLFPKVRIEVGPGLWDGILARGQQTGSVYRSSQRPPQDITRARKDFGYNPTWDVDRALPDWVRWLKTGEYGEF